MAEAENKRSRVSGAGVIRLLRPHQWSKNLLVFASMVAGHQFMDLEILQLTALCFVSFCLVASGGYVINDVVDVRDDREHPRKKMRPIASGQVGIALALLLAVLLLVGGLTVAWMINPTVFLCVAGYLLATEVYTFWAKKKLLLDIVFLAGLYTARIVAGIVVTNITPGFWLLAFSMFVFSSLATLKRFIEISDRPARSLAAYSGRAYVPEDRQIIAMLGIANGCMSVLVLAFYLNSAEVTRLYARPAVLWLVCPLFMYWIGRVWLLASRSLVHDDPIVFALRDRVSYLMVAIFAVIAVAAT